MRYKKIIGGTKEELHKKFPWIADVDIKNAVVDMTGTWLIWENGLWKGGLWKGGLWKGGLWKGGLWKGGLWKGGTWKNGLWEYGVWEYGVWENGVWKGGTWKGGVWKGGVWGGGVWEGGIKLKNNGGVRKAVKKDTEKQDWLKKGQQEGWIEDGKVVK